MGKKLSPDMARNCLQKVQALRFIGNKLSPNCLQKVQARRFMGKKLSPDSVGTSTSCLSTSTNSPTDTRCPTSTSTSCPSSTSTSTSCPEHQHHHQLVLTESYMSSVLAPFDEDEWWYWNEFISKVNGQSLEAVGDELVAEEDYQYDRVAMMKSDHERAMQRTLLFKSKFL
jgi:hypothetical protein